MVELTFCVYTVVRIMCSLFTPFTDINLIQWTTTILYATDPNGDFNGTLYDNTNNYHLSLRNFNRVCDYIPSVANPVRLTGKIPFHT